MQRMVQEAVNVRLWAVLHGVSHSRRCPFLGEKGAVCSSGLGLAIDHANLLQRLEDKESACSAGDTGVVFDPWVVGRSLEEEAAAHSRLLTWKTSWTKELGGLHSWDASIRHDSH